MLIRRRARRAKGLLIRRRTRIDTSRVVSSHDLVRSRCSRCHRVIRGDDTAARRDRPISRDLGVAELRTSHVRDHLWGSSQISGSSMHAPNRNFPKRLSIKKKDNKWAADKSAVGPLILLDGQLISVPCRVCTPSAVKCWRAPCVCITTI